MHHSPLTSPTAGKLGQGEVNARCPVAGLALERRASGLQLLHARPPPARAISTLMSERKQGDGLQDLAHGIWSERPGPDSPGGSRDHILVLLTSGLSPAASISRDRQLALAMLALRAPQLLALRMGGTSVLDRGSGSLR